MTDDDGHVSTWYCITLEHCQQVYADLAPIPVLLNIVAGSVTPDLGLDEANRLGFKIVIYPVATLGPVIEEVSRYMKQLKVTKRNPMSELQKSGGVRSMFNICGIAECFNFDIRAGGTSFRSGL